MQQFLEDPTFTKYFEDVVNSQLGIENFFSGNPEKGGEHNGSLAKGKLLWLNPLAYDDSNAQCQCSLYICQSVESISHDQLKKKIQQCEKLTKQLRARLLKDYNEGIINTSFSKFKYKALTPSFTIGSNEVCGMHLEFLFNMPETIAYDPERED